MGRNLEAYVHFFELIAADKNEEAVSFHRDNYRRIKRALRTKAVKNYFGKLDVDAKAKYLLYVIFDEEKVRTQR
jgi:hypothetical protein